ncbi:MAG: hypothetical protein ACE5JT_03850 [Nitrosopumilaceae archaeon]
MSWLRMPLKFPGTCIVCKKKININEIALWSKGQGVKHEKCAEVIELKCTVCGGPAGCPKCEFRDNCDLEAVSQLCICTKCESKTDSFYLYQQAVLKKFRVLNSTA